MKENNKGKIMDNLLLHKLFDYKNGKLYWKVAKSNRIKVGDVAGYATKHGYRKIYVVDKQLYEHRVIFFYHNNFLPKFLDHIDGDKSNNAIENLREVTFSQNMMNTKIKTNNTSGTKGVCWDKARQKWKVRVTFNNKTVNIGRFEDAELAQLASIEAMDKYHKQFARFQ